MQKSNYEILELQPNAEPAEIKKAFYRLAKIYHPDRPDGNEEVYREVVRAYNELMRFSPKKKTSSYTREGYDNLQAHAIQKRQRKIHIACVNEIMKRAILNNDIEVIKILSNTIEELNKII